jgi:hypothetical protein
VDHFWSSAAFPVVADVDSLRALVAKAVRRSECDDGPCCAVSAAIFFGVEPLTRHGTRVMLMVDNYRGSSRWVTMRLFAASLGLFFFGALATAQVPEEIKSGPQAGEFLPGPFHYVNANGIFANRPHCLVCEYGLRPTVAIFTHETEPSKPLADLLQKLDAAVAKYHDAGLRCFAVILTDDVAKENARRELLAKLDKFALDANLKNVALCVGPAVGPEKYNINKDSEATVLLYSKLKVAENYPLTKRQLNERYINAILGSVDQLVGKK